LFAAVLASFRNRAALQVEILALRHQLGVLHRSVKRPRLTAVDRLFWAWLSELWSDWRTVLVIVQPETVIAWHRKSFQLFWTWKVRSGNRGRPAVTEEVRTLIRKMSRRRGGPFLLIMSRAWSRSTSSPCQPSGSRSYTCSWCWHTTGAGFSTSA
jgi:hypothetical protein